MEATDVGEAHANGRDDREMSLEGPSALERLAVFAAATDVATLPPDVVDRAKTCIIDALFGAFLVQSDSRAKAALASQLLDQPGHLATVIGSRHRAAPGDAAFVFAAATAATDRSDTHLPTATHPGLAVVPAALALGEAAGTNGAAVLAGVVVGYEIMCRLARALVTPKLAAIWRPTAVVAPIAAAFAGARTLSLTTGQTVAAAALAAQTASGFNEWAHAGTGEHPFHAAFAARNAVTAVLLAQQGAVAAPTILEGRSGLFAAFGAEQRRESLTASVVEALGQEFESRAVVHKPAPACFFVQTPCQLALEISREIETSGADPERIAAIEIRVTDVARRYPGCDNPGPVNAHQSAIMSIQYSVAAVLVAGGIYDRNWFDPSNPAANRLAGRARVIADERLTAAYPERQGAGVRVMFDDGRVVERKVDNFQSMSRAEVIERFLAAATPWLGRSQAEIVIDCVQRLDAIDDLHDLTALLRLQ